MIKRFIVAAFAAALGGDLFALFANAFHGRYMIGYDYDSMLIAGGVFGLLTAVGLTLLGALSTKAGPVRQIITGTIAGAALYLGNVYLHLNAGFRWTGLAEISLGGAICAAFAAMLLWSVFSPLPSEKKD